MCAATKRLELQIDVLDQGRHRALALADLLPAELIGGVLHEFQEVEYLGTDSGEYRLVNVAGDQELEPAKNLGSQLDNGAVLRLEERPTPRPAGAQSTSQDLYLREQGTGRVFKLAWLPAIVGRTDATLPDNQLVAVNLDNFPTGLRVSRRHVRISQAGGAYFAECMSGNPATIRRTSGVTLSLDKGRQPIVPGDTLLLERSEIALKFLVRPTPPEPSASNDAAAGPGASSNGADEPANSNA